MSIRKPPSQLTTPNYVTLKKGTTIERVHNRNFAANAFNPCQGNPTRFAPIHDKNGVCIPSLYAGETFEAAVFETIFHDVPAKARRKSVPQKKITDSNHGHLEVMCDLNLVSLREPDLNAWRIKRNQLISSSPKLYSGTAEWAEAIHHQFSKAEGLVWTSNQCDPASAYLFFGDRVKPKDLKIILTRIGLTDAQFRKDVHDIGKRSRIRITVLTSTVIASDLFVND